MDILIYTIIGFAIGIILLPLIRYWGITFKFVDTPNQRKLHVSPIPALGGVVVFLAIAAFFTLNPHLVVFPQWQLFILLLTVLFITGLLDDKFDLPSLIRLGIQLGCATFLALNGVKIDSLYGILGIYEIPEILQIPFTVVVITGVVNAFNLIDGIDGLAGGLSFINATVLTVIFFMIGLQEMALFCALLSGVLFSFLVYNFQPAKIFMGDSGSLILGFIFSALALYIIKIDVNNVYPIEVNINLAIGLVALPVFDTIRLFAERIWHGKSPFSADKNHIHHLVLNKHQGHMKASYVIYIIHCAFVITSLISSRLPLSILLTILIIEYFLCIFWYKNKNLSPKPDSDYLLITEEEG